LIYLDHYHPLFIFVFFFKKCMRVQLPFIILLWIFIKKKIHVKEALKKKQKKPVIKFPPYFHQPHTFNTGHILSPLVVFSSINAREDTDYLLFCPCLFLMSLDPSPSKMSLVFFTTKDRFLVCITKGDITCSLKHFFYLKIYY